MPTVKTSPEELDRIVSEVTANERIAGTARGGRSDDRNDGRRTDFLSLLEWLSMPYVCIGETGCRR